MGFDGDWLDAAIAATADRPPSGLHGTATLRQGSDDSFTMSIEDGRVAGPSRGTPDVMFPFTSEQVQAYLDRTFDPAVAYMKGDLKPEGSTASLIAVLDVLSWLHSRG